MAIHSFRCCATMFLLGPYKRVFQMLLVSASYPLICIFSPTLFLPIGIILMQSMVYPKKINNKFDLCQLIPCILNFIIHYRIICP